MRFLIHLFFRSFICAVVFSILLEQILVIGILCGIISGVLFSFLVSNITSTHTSSFKGLWSIPYYLLLFRDMVKSTFYVSRSIFFRTLPPLTILNEDSHAPDSNKVLVSNSITLTPGTVTLEEDEHGYTILQLSSGEAVDSVSSTFEDRIPERTIRYDN